LLWQLHAAAAGCVLLAKQLHSVFVVQAAEGPGLGLDLLTQTSKPAMHDETAISLDQRAKLMIRLFAQSSSIAPPTCEQDAMVTTDYGL
jgi:hypothetical protein